MAKEGSEAGKFYNEATIDIIYDSVHRNVQEMAKLDFYSTLLEFINNNYD